MFSQAFNQSPNISIHALRVEGDGFQMLYLYNPPKFLSTPSGWRATPRLQVEDPAGSISIHALRVEGDNSNDFINAAIRNFYPRPPGGGRPSLPVLFTVVLLISIHALRVEGDLSVGASHAAGLNFYPRPPGGGRPLFGDLYDFDTVFLSTPSGWRATLDVGGGQHGERISIHALRVEGDWGHLRQRGQPRISIHALRVEGDSKNGQSFRLFLRKREKNLPL